MVALRLARSGLDSPAESIESAVTRMVGAHAQVMTAAELSLGIRTSGLSVADVRAAVAPGGQLVKTYGPRGTIHLLPRADLPRWCAALGALPSATSLPEKDRLSTEQVTTVVSAIGTILASETARARPPDADQLGREVIRLTGSWAADPVTPAFGGMWPRWRQAIGAAARAGVLAFGEIRGSRVTYVNPGVVIDQDADSAVAWLVHEFLRAYGPATPAQFARWLGVRPALAVREFERLSPELSRVRFAGHEAVVSAGDEAAFAAESPNHARHSIRLLPHFDPYLIGSFPRELVFPGIAGERALAHGQAGTHPVILVDGVVGGIWHARRTSRRFELAVEPFTALNRNQRAEVEAEASRMAGFLGLEVIVAFAPVTARAHL